ncbi:hypothetical protein LOTGIDRAFT_153623 [Lottia gigantea]|uniref:SEA domain-containing protein n=1 Tax=Lottia gigantea TaxID=225164 RepID=V3ZIS6_LOTGI|nr:hypothetical protein LOTGIDRAFT_153623 [Lottia gigantea]ESO91193.1 hypothetical protein LOTGIDRAFT_153623 [Lottia gigantea]
MPLKGSFVDAETIGVKIPYRCPEAMFYCEYDGQCYSYKHLCVPDETSTQPFITNDPVEDTTVQLEDSTTVDETTVAVDLDSTTDINGETTPQDDKSTVFVTKSGKRKITSYQNRKDSSPDLASQPSTLDHTIDDQTGPVTTVSEGSKVFVGSTESVVVESTLVHETAETTPSVEDPKTTKEIKAVPSSTDQMTSGVTLGRTTDESSSPVTSHSLPTVTSDQSTSSSSTNFITSSSIKESSSSPTVDIASSSSTETTSSQTSSTPTTTPLPTTVIPSSNTTVGEDDLVQTSIKPTQASSNSVILVFKGLLANPYHFNATLVTDLTAMLNETLEIAPNPFILRLHQFGPKNSTITTEVSAVQFYTDENLKTVSRVVPSTEILSALSGNTTADWKIADLEFVCGYPSKNKPCVTLPLPYKPTVVTTAGLFENNKDLFIAIFVLASLFLLILVLGLIYLRCRQKRCSSYETNNVKLEKAKLTSAAEVNPEINSPLSDKEIMKVEMETSLSQNGAPPLDKDAGWIIPLDQILDNRKNSSSEDTKL